jgi:hypothetical protein
MTRILVACALVASMMGCGGAAAHSAPPQSGVDAWPVKWCQAAPGNTKEELVAIMGPPTDTTPTTMTWAAKQYRFYAFLGADGRARQLDINPYSLSPVEQAALKCDKIRTKNSMARTTSPSKTPRQYPLACTLVTDAEMSAILGAAVAADSKDRSNARTECHYNPASGISPAVKLSVDWGDGRVAMKASGAVRRYEPGISNPYAGIGDEAAAVGPALMIRTGEDLVTIVFTGVSGAPAKARRIFETAKARM